LLVGDAAGYVDALTGEGINVGLAAARELVGCLARNAPREYDQAWNKASRRYRTITESLLWTARNPLLRRMIVPAAAACPPAFGAVVRQLA